MLFPLPPLPDYSEVLTDKDGQLMHAFLTRDEKWRFKADPDELSPELRKALLAKEDRYFYIHPGINPFAVLRALVNNVLMGRRTSGASTITMQVARMLERRPRNVWSKTVEAFRALQLEWQFSKTDILQLYVSMVPMGGNIEGLKTGSWMYFGKSPDHLSLAEGVALCVIPNRPNSLRMGRYNAAIEASRNKWLIKFKQAGLSDAATIADAIMEPLTATRLPMPKLAPHLAARLWRKGISSPRSTVDIQMQTKAEKLVADYMRPWKWYGIHNAAVLVVDNRSMEVRAYVGSADFYDTTDAGQVDGVTAVRQPGSTLKPLLYSLAIDAGLITPTMKILDVPVSFGGYAPLNYDQQFNGPVSAGYALSHSLNIPAVRLLQQLGKDELTDALVRCDFAQIRKDQNKLGLSMVLGGCGATLEELTGLFGVFANGGLYRKPTMTIGQSNPVATRIISEASAYMLGELLSDVQRPDFPVNWSSTEKLPRIAWKTGTSYGRRDAWSIGYNKNYTIGVWVGNFSGVGIPELSGASVATPLLFRLFNTIDYQPEADWFNRPADCDFRMVCSETGLPPSPFCVNKTSDYFIPLISPARLCNHLVAVMVSEKEDLSYCSYCAPPTGFRQKFYPNLTPEWAAWYAENKIAFQRIPPHNAQCQRVFAENGPVILSPRPGTDYFTSKQHPEPLTLQCRTETDVARVFWYVNDRLYKSAHPAERVFYMPVDGVQKISCTDDKGRSKHAYVKVSLLN